MTELTATQRAAAALAALDVSPARLRQLLGGWTPPDAWAALRAGLHPDDHDGRLHGLAVTADLDEIGRRCESAGLAVLVHGHPGYPARLADDPEAPAVLFAEGDPLVLHAGAVTVAVVGTRAASSVGRRAAAEIGRGLSEAGVCVVSGLALGIDLAAHEGALSCAGASPVAVVGSPPGAPCAPDQRRVRHGVASAGVVLSEQAPGTSGARWRFAARNRIMAGLADLVVVVESHLEGGAWHTVRAARQRHVPLAAVPGSLANAASAGTNSLLVDGAATVRGAGDVLRLLGLEPLYEAERGSVRRRASLSVHARLVRRAMGGDPMVADDLARRTGLSLGALSVALEELSAAGMARDSGGWWQRQW